MRYTMLGHTGLLVSRLAFRAMTFTAGNKDMSAVYKVGADLADTLVGRALDSGVTFFDTTDGYAGGESEMLLSRALQSHRNNVVIATKVGFRTGPALTQAGLSRRHISWSVDQSLKRLGTDGIDVYIAHREDPYTPLEETLSALDAVVRSGKVRYLDSRTGRHGRRRPRWRSRRPTVSRRSPTARCTTHCSVGMSNAT